MKENYKVVELTIDGEQMTFRVDKLNALDGMYLLKFVTEKVTPALGEAIDHAQEIDAGGLSVRMLMNILPKMLREFSREELNEVSVLCLQHVFALLPAGYQQVMDANGHFGVAEVETSVSACLQLLYESIVLNCAGFFEESGLLSKLGIQVGPQQEQKM